MINTDCIHSAVCKFNGGMNGCGGCGHYMGNCTTCAMNIKGVCKDTYRGFCKFWIPLVEEEECGA